MVSVPPELVARIRRVSRVVVVTGAGMSAESGVPTFRGAPNALWTDPQGAAAQASASRYKPIIPDDPTRLASAEGFLNDPRQVWEWYCWRRDLVMAAEPHDGHRVLAGWQQRFPEWLLVTQNVDGLHQRAGSRGVVELHGTILRARCFDRGHTAETWPDTGPGGPLPRCVECGSRMRPDVVWFGESLPAAALQQACAAAADCEVLFSIGTSSVVYPAAGIAEIALESGATVVEINPAETPLSSTAHFQLRGPCGGVLKELARQLSD